MWRAERPGWVFIAVAWGGFLAVVVWAVTWLFPRGRSRPSGHRDAVQQDAAGLLDRRFASGEIDEDTYRETAMGAVHFCSALCTAAFDADPARYPTSSLAG